MVDLDKFVRKEWSSSGIGKSWNRYTVSIPGQVSSAEDSKLYSL